MGCVSSSKAAAASVTPDTISGQTLLVALASENVKPQPCVRDIVDDVTMDAQDVAEVREIIQGLLASFLGSSAAEVMPTDAEAAAAMQYFRAAVAGYQAGGLARALDALQNLRDGVEELRPAMVRAGTATGVSVTDLGSLKAALQQLATPTEVQYRPRSLLCVNRVDITSAAEAATKDFDAARWMDFGRATGSILAALHNSPVDTHLDEDEQEEVVIASRVIASRGFVKRSMPGEPSDAAEGGDNSADAKLSNYDVHVLTEALEGFVGEAVSASTLLSNSAVALSHFEEAVHAFEAKTLSSVVLALKRLADGSEVLRAAMGDVGSAGEEAQRLACALDLMREPKEIVFHMGRALLVDSTEVLDLVDRALQEYSAGRWKEFGVALRNMAEELLVTKEKSDEKGLLPAWLFESCCAPPRPEENEDVSPAVSGKKAARRQRQGHKRLGV